MAESSFQSEMSVISSFQHRALPIKEPSSSRRNLPEESTYLPTPTSLPHHFPLSTSTDPPLHPNAETRISPSCAFDPISSSCPPVRGQRQTPEAEVANGGASADVSDVESSSIAQNDNIDSTGNAERWTFFGDVDMDVDGESQMDTGRMIDNRPLTFEPANSAFSSTHRPHRPARARYASSDSSASPPRGDFSSAPRSSQTPVDNLQPPSHKRTFSYVSPSTGQTPPSLGLSSFPTSLVSPPRSPDSMVHLPLLDLSSASSLSNDLAPIIRPSSSDPSTTDVTEYLRTRQRTHSFESQRAATTLRASGRRNLLEVARESVEGETSRSGSLRRRSPANAEEGGSSFEGSTSQGRMDRERGGSKRRRASTLLSSTDDVAMTDEATRTTHQDMHTFAPALGRFPSQVHPVEPVLSPMTSRTTNARSMLGSLGCLPIGGSSSIEDISNISRPSTRSTRSRPTSPRRFSLSNAPLWWRSNPVSPSLDSSTYAPTRRNEPLSSTHLSAFGDDERLHSDRSEALHRRSDDILREVASTLRARQVVLDQAEESSERARRLLSQDRQERQRQERERRISDLPDVAALPEPAELASRPVIGVRVGTGFPSIVSSSANAPPQPRRRRSSLFSLSPPSSPDHQSTTTESTGTSSRTRQFLTRVRPRFSRNSTSISGSTPTPLDHALSASDYDERVERQAANELNERLLERRRVSASLEPGPTIPNTSSNRSGSLWGEDLTLTSRWRLRGPTERENGRWRRGEPPSLASGSTTPALNSTNPSASVQRHGLSANLITPLTSMATSLWDTPQIDNDASDTAARDYFGRRDDSPSPQRGVGVQRRTDSLIDLNFDDILADLGGDRGRTDVLTVEGGLASDRPLNPIHVSRPAPTSRPSIDTRIRLDDDDDDDENDGDSSTRPSSSSQWNPPQLPLMLPSGSSGRRMVFPHPANAAGMTDPMVAAEEGRAGAGVLSTGERPPTISLFGAFSPRHLEDSDGQRIEPTVGFQAARYSRPRFMPWDEPTSTPRLNPFGDLPPPTTTTSSADAAASLPTYASPHLSDSAANSRTVPPAQTTLADTLSQYGSHAPSPRETTLRRRHVGASTTEFGSTSTSTTSLDTTQNLSADAIGSRLAEQRQNRLERLAALRRERTFMRGILGVGGSDINDDPPPLNRARSTSPTSRDRFEPERNGSDLARSPGTARRRGLGDFFRGLGTGGRLISIFDEDFGAFWGRDAVALDSRNYLEDDEFDSSYEALLRLSASIGDAKPKGVPVEKLSALRTFPYSQWPYIVHQRPSPSTNAESPLASTSATKIEEEKPDFARKGIDKEATCPVCLSDYEEDDLISLAHCSHGFHSDCLKAWLKDHGSCPVCRRDHSSEAS